MALKKGDYFVLVNEYTDKYYKDDVFVVTEESEYANDIHCSSLYRNESFRFQLRSIYYRMVSLSAAQKRIMAAIDKREKEIVYLNNSLDKIFRD